MRNSTLIRYSILTIIFVFCLQILSAQNANTAAAGSPTAEWVRLQSDDGDFSIEMPSDYELFSDKKGFVAAAWREDLEFKDVKFLNAYQDKALMTVESYNLKNPKKGLDLLSRNLSGKEAGISRGSLRGRQIISRGDKAYSVVQFFTTETNLYVIFTAAKDENSAAMKRFLGSISSESPANGIKTIRFSELKDSSFLLTDESKSVGNDLNQSVIGDNAKSANDNESSSPLIMLYQPRPQYTPTARDKRINGTMQLRVTFSASGRISKIGVLSFMPEGMTKQAVFAALRIKFLPAEKNGNPISVTKIVEYMFRIS